MSLLTTAVFVCRRCGLGLSLQALSDGRRTFRHRAGHGLRSCGQRPDPIERTTPK